MTDDREILLHLLSHPDQPVDEAWVRSMEVKYPYFPLPELLQALRQGVKPDSELLERMALTLSSSDTVRTLIDPNAPPADFYPPEEAAPSPSTNSTIDTFLATYGTTDPAETATLEKLIFNPVADYSQTLMRDADPATHAPTGNEHDDLINRFILSHSGADGAETTPAAPSPKPRRENRHRKPQQPAAAPENSLLSESLAKIYIKSRRYDRAYEILSNLSLSFPEKSAYFADQMRFLRKLMLNEEFRRRREK